MERLPIGFQLVQQLDQLQISNFHSLLIPGLVIGSNDTSAVLESGEQITQVWFFLPIELWPQTLKLDRWLQSLHLPNPDGATMPTLVQESPIGSERQRMHLRVMFPNMEQANTRGHVS
jgi:hypothetical protein